MNGRWIRFPLLYPEERPFAITKSSGHSLGFMAEGEDKVDEFYKAAMSAGARDNISPRARLEYYPGYYAADVFDPDGYSFEVVHKS